MWRLIQPPPDGKHPPALARAYASGEESRASRGCSGFGVQGSGRAAKTLGQEQLACYIPSMKSDGILKRFNWNRLSGPFTSLAFHALIVWVAVTLITYEAPPEVDQVQVELVELNDLQLEEIEPLEMPELEPLTDEVEPLDNTQLAEIVEPVDVSVDMPDMSDASMLDNLSPLVLTGIGADQGSLQALTARYGQRAAQNGLLGTYFNRIDFTGTTYSRIDPTLNYDWGLESPWRGRVNEELFSVIWTGRIVPPRSGTYTLYLESDDGARLWIDGKLVLDQFIERERATDTIEIKMLIGKSYQIKYAYCDIFYHAVSRLEWSCDEAGIPRQLIPPEHMWADGRYSRQMMAWNEQRGSQYVNRESMLNPGMMEDQPFSHIVGFQNLNEEALERLELKNLVSEFNAFKTTGRNPYTGLPEMPSGYEKEQKRERASRDVVIEIL
jgi:hypothetical protein